MKLKYFIYMFSCLSLIIGGCSDFEDDRLKFEDSSPLYVKFTDVKSKTIKERDTLTVKVETPQVSYAGPITIEYSITGDLTQNGTVVIPAGERTASFEIIAPDNAVIDVLKNSTVTITAVDNGITVGRGSNGISKSFQLKVEDDLKVAFFVKDTVEGFESKSKIDAAEVVLTNEATTQTIINYSISGGTEGVDYIDNGGGTMTIEQGKSSAFVPIEVIDNLVINDPPTKLTITIESIVGDDETSIDQDSSILEYTILDDLKFIGLTDGDIELEDLTEATAKGNHAFEVTMDGESSEIVTVNYSVTGTGVTNVTGGSIKFYPGGKKTAEIIIKLNASAFSSDQTVLIHLSSIVSADGEVLFNEDNSGRNISLELKAD